MRCLFIINRIRRKANLPNSLRHCCRVNFRRKPRTDRRAWSASVDRYTARPDYCHKGCGCKGSGCSTAVADDTADTSDIALPVALQ